MIEKIIRDINLKNVVGADLSHTELLYINIFQSLQRIVEKLNVYTSKYYNGYKYIGESPEKILFKCNTMIKNRIGMSINFELLMNVYNIENTKDTNDIIKFYFSNIFKIKIDFIYLSDNLINPEFSKNLLPDLTCLTIFDIK